MSASNFVGSEIAGALARFFAGGAGPSHASISSSFALAGYDEPDETGNKQDRVLQAVRRADDTTAMRLVEELLNLLRSAGEFDRDPTYAPIASLRTAFQRRGFHLTADGYVDWEVTEPPGTSAPQPIPPTPAASEERPPISGAPELAVPNVELLTAILRRLASALRPLTLRRHSRVGLQVKDEYDLQDLVEALLRSLFNDVRPEERTPSYAGASSVIDFLLKDDGLAVEVKVTRPGRLEKHIKEELLVDLHDYERHPSVRTLIAVVYDIESTFRNPAGFEKDLTGRHGNLDVRVLVVGWPIPRG
jgi:hypothetical protein